MTFERRTGLPIERDCTTCGRLAGQKCVETFIQAGDDGELVVSTREMIRFHPARAASIVLDVAASKPTRSKRK